MGESMLGKVTQITKRIAAVSLFLISPVCLSTQVIEIGQITTAASTDNEFQSFTFSAPFASVPNLFMMTTDQGSDPCTVRVENITVNGFDAVCLEPENEDGAHPGMSIDFIAIVDGTTTVPDNNGGNVIFESKCVETNVQQYSSSQCTNCSGATGWVSVSFDNTFVSPAVITQTQTTANDNPNNDDPAFIDVATQALSSTGFQVSNEQMEAGNGPLSTNERICYLAVEDDGCKDLDFSSFGEGGPSSVTFEATKATNSVDGWDNGCSAGEGASYTSGCFTNTPISVAKQNSRNGPDGGMIRRCATGTGASEIVLTYDEDQIGNDERGHTTESVSALAFGSIFTTPVTMDSAFISQLGRQTTFEWTTSSETFHLGFNIWGELDGQWTQLNKRLIPSSGQDVLTSKSYEHSVRLSREEVNKIDIFGISAVDSAGDEEFFGPLKLNTNYGESNLAESIDWSAERQQFNQRMQAQGYQLINKRWKRVSNQRQKKLQKKHYALGQETVDILIDRLGVYSLSYDDIHQLIPSWTNTPINHIAFTLNGEALPRYIASDDDKFNQGDVIIFAGNTATGYNAIYQREQTYQLLIDKDKVRSATHYVNSEPVEDSQSQAYVTQTLTKQSNYSAIITVGDPWFDSILYSTGTPASKEYVFSFSDPIDTSKPAKLAMSVFGALDLSGNPETDPDHHIQVYLNNELVHDHRFDGLNEYVQEISIAADKIKQHDNTVRIDVVGDTGKIADVIYIDDLKVSAFSDLSNISNQSYFDYEANSSASAYHFNTDVPIQNWSVVSYQANGNLSIINDLSYLSSLNGSSNLSAVGSTIGSTTYSTVNEQIAFHTVPAHDQIDGVYYAATVNNQWLRPLEVSLSEHQKLSNKKINYHIVAHPNFINDELDQFVQAKEALGYNVQLNDWLDIVKTYGFGNDNPAALDNFLVANNRQSAIGYVLIVGGNTYDYHKRTADDIVNFIPTHYRKINRTGFSPTDIPFSDLDKDGLPDLAIGRWPVRSTDDLSYIIKKSIDWQKNTEQQNYRDALLIAEQVDNNNLEYKNQIDLFVSHHLENSAHIDKINKVYIEDIDNTDTPIKTARAMISQAINSGVTLTSFSGHGSLSAWGKQGIINTQTIQSFENSGTPTFVMPLACYTTHYESPSVNSLAHQWMFAGDKGAAAIYGATVLGSYRENAIFAERLIKEQTQQISLTGSASIGKSILNVKRKLSANNEIINNWTLLGDPSLAF